MLWWQRTPRSSWFRGLLAVAFLLVPLSLHSSMTQVSYNNADATVADSAVLPIAVQNTRTTSNITGATVISQKANSRQEVLPWHIQKRIQELQELNIRYYMYDHPEMLQEPIIRQLEQGQTLPKLRSKVMFAQREVEILRTLQSHSLRTWNQSEASVFLIPIPVGAILCVSSDAPTVYQQAFGALREQPALNHKPHLLISLNLLLFDRAFHTKARAHQYGLGPIYPLLANVTVALSYDLTSISQSPRQKHDYSRFFANRKGYTRKTFGLGLFPGFSFPHVAATWNKFQNSQFFLFYHTRTLPSAHNSTQYRLALLNATTSQLPRSSIGHDIPKEVWKERFPDSKFCLVVRGDTPDSHSLLRAVKVGCLPVVVSDYYTDYAPFLKDSLNMKDYCIFVEEERFWKNPLLAIQSLQDRNESVLKGTIHHLQLAQRITMPDHPESLFVPALLKQTLNAEHS